MLSFVLDGVHPHDIGTILDLSEKLFKGQASGWLLAQYLWYSTPRFVYYVLPMATLVAGLGILVLQYIADLYNLVSGREPPFGIRT